MSGVRADGTPVLAMAMTGRTVITERDLMSRNRSIRAALVALAGLGALSDTAPAFALNTAYYVDASGGSDTNPGTSEAAAWKTLAKVNTMTFSQGDKILLRAGETWVEQIRPKGSGVNGR